MSTLDLVTIIVAIYGAMLATFTFVIQQIEKREKVKATLSLGFVSHGASKPIDVVILEAANFGNVPVHLSSCHLSLPATKDKLVARFQYSREFPVTLNPGESVTARIESETFIQIVRKSMNVSEVVAVAEFSNKGGGSFRSKPERLIFDRMLFAKENAA